MRQLALLLTVLACTPAAAEPFPVLPQTVSILPEPRPVWVALPDVAPVPPPRGYALTPRHPPLPTSRPAARGKVRMVMVMLA